MLNKKYFLSLRSDSLGYAEKRRDVIKTAGDAQHRAKRAIFALQRGSGEAKAALAEAGGLLKGLYKKYKQDPRLLDEGSYRAALEEFVEAALFADFTLGKEIGEIKGLVIEPDIYIAGLCDVPGEIVRFAINAATARDFATVKKCHLAAQAIIGELIDMNLTGYQRQKFDQAKQAFHKLEQVVYEVSLKNS